MVNSQPPKIIILSRITAQLFNANYSRYIKHNNFSCELTCYCMSGFFHFSGLWQNYYTVVKLKLMPAHINVACKCNYMSTKMLMDETLTAVCKEVCTFCLVLTAQTTKCNFLCFQLGTLSNPKSLPPFHKAPDAILSMFSLMFLYNKHFNYCLHFCKHKCLNTNIHS